jgi:hypothetical protein
MEILLPLAAVVIVGAIVAVLAYIGNKTPAKPEDKASPFDGYKSPWHDPQNDHPSPKRDEWREATGIVPAKAKEPEAPLYHAPLDPDPADEDKRIADELVRHTAEALAASEKLHAEATKARETKLTKNRLRRIAANATRANAAAALAAKTAVHHKKKKLK